MTTIGSTNSYYASLRINFGKSDDSKNTDNGGNIAGPRQSSAGGMTGSDTVFGAKLADALWTMESEGVELEQNADDTWLGEPPSTTYEDEFLELSKKTYAERIREQYLEEHGLTEEDVKAMSPEDREAVEAEIREAILEAMGINGQKQEIAMDVGGGAAGAQAAGIQASPGKAEQDAKDDPLLSM